MMHVTEEKVRDVQAGFRKRRGCIDQVFSLGCIADKCLETFNLLLHVQLMFQTYEEVLQCARNTMVLGR